MIVSFAYKVSLRVLMVIYRAADPRKAQAGMRARPTKEIKNRERGRGREKKKEKRREREREREREGEEKKRERCVCVARVAAISD